MNTGRYHPGDRDERFDRPYIDVDEWRSEPLRHRYIHGGFEGNDTRFTFHLPPAERYEGRFFQPIFAVPGAEHMETGRAMGGFGGGAVPFSLASGAYLVESNQGSFNAVSTEDWTVTGYKASAGTARYSRVVAQEMYGAHRPYGYVLGGSGGAYKTMSCFENMPGLWDGAVPFVHGHPMSVPNAFTVQNHAMRILRDKFAAIVDAIEPGGSGDMFAGLNAEEREALAEVTRMGFPPRAWFDVERVARQFHGVWAFLVDNLTRWDPEYFTDFWTVPGYLGADPPPSLAAARVQDVSVVKETVNRREAGELGLPMPTLQAIGADPDAPVALRMVALPQKSLQGATLEIKSGAAAGRRLSIVERVDDVVIASFGQDNREGLKGLAPGDEVFIDNSTYLASLTYHRHQYVPGYEQWEQFQAGGQPIYPQRPKLIGPRSVRYNCGSVQTGRFSGKMIVVQTLMDEAAYPINVEHYRRLVESELGERMDDHYRLWFVDYAMHGEPLIAPKDPRPDRRAHIVGYAGVIQQALRDLADWVEKDVAPPPSTPYEVVGGQVFLPFSATERRGVQPVVTLTANGGAKAEVTVGEEVRFVGVAEVPPGAGAVVGAEWDFEGKGDYPLQEIGVEGDHAKVEVIRTFAFERPGTYFPVLRVTSQRQGDAKSPYGRIQNLGRVRVVVG